MKYLLPCTCGQSIVVDVSQAGRMVSCACGQTQEAPPMRAIRTLQPAQEANAREAAVRRPPAWSPLQGGLFVVGMLLLSIGIAAAGFYSYRIQQIDIPAPTEADFINDANQLDKMPLDEVYESYLMVREVGLGQPEVPLYAIAQRLEGLFQKYVIAGIIAAVIGLVMIASAFVIRPKSSPL